MVNKAAGLLSSVIEWVKSHPAECKDISGNAADAQRFIRTFGLPISFSTPHLYVSALPFSPKKSCIFTKFANALPSVLQILSKLTPITTLEGKEFLVAWWEVVKCHRTLWRRGVHHRDVNPSNLMGNRSGGRFISVFNDFDLSSIKQRPECFERTGMVPFMALDLLTPKAIAGEVEHVYRHDAESFIWVLTWICLRHEGGKLLSKDRPLDDWLTLGAIGCRKEKTDFLTMGLCDKHLRTPISQNESWMVAKKCLAVIHKYTGPFETVPTDDEVVFQTWLQDHVPADVRGGNLLSAQ